MVVAHLVVTNDAALATTVSTCSGPRTLAGQQIGRLTEMKRYSGAVAVGIGAVIALGSATACSSSSRDTAPPSAAMTAAVTPMPTSASFVTDAPESNGDAMTMAITVEGNKVVAYATNGTDDEAYFFGTQSDGHLDMMSMYGDHLTGSFDGRQLSGEMTMNEPGTVAVKFAAASVTAPAGLYTAMHDNSRATWVVRPDHTMTGVMDNSAPGDHKVTDAVMARDQAFMERVRQMRMDRQLQPAPAMTYGSWSMHMGDSAVTAVRVTGDMSF